MVSKIEIRDKDKQSGVIDVINWSYVIKREREKKEVLNGCLEIKSVQISLMIL